MEMTETAAVGGRESNAAGREPSQRLYASAFYLWVNTVGSALAGFASVCAGSS